MKLGSELLCQKAEGAGQFQFIINFFSCVSVNPLFPLNCQKDEIDWNMSVIVTRGVGLGPFIMPSQVRVVNIAQWVNAYNVKIGRKILLKVPLLISLLLIRGIFAILKCC
jgi:hypothetical protein